MIAVGAILAFGVRYDMAWLDLDVVGWVLMLAGLTGLLLTFHFWNRRRRATGVVTERHYYNGRAAPSPVRDDTVVEEERVRTRPPTTVRRTERLNTDPRP